MFKYTWQRRIVAATPLIALVIFLFIGFQFDLWHPGWVVFLLIPIVPFLVGLKQIRITFPLVIVVIFFTLGAFGYWHPSWLLFLLIPIQNILFPPKSIKLAVNKAKVNSKSKYKDYVDVDVDDAS